MKLRSAMVKDQPIYLMEICMRVNTTVERGMGRYV